MKAGKRRARGINRIVEILFGVLSSYQEEMTVASEESSRSSEICSAVGRFV